MTSHYVTERIDPELVRATHPDFDEAVHLVVPGTLLTDERLTWRAKGLWAVIQTLPPGSPISAKTLAGVGPDGRDAVATALRELRAAGWLSTAPIRAEVHNLARHLTLHRLAVRDGSWVCHICRVELIDVCSDEDVVLAADGGRMVDPSSPKRLPTVDHLIAVELGGSESDENLALACRPCNSAKGAM